jgi:hypothetical protein
MCLKVCYQKYATSKTILICFVQNRREKKSLRSDATDTHISDVSGDGHEGDYAAANLIVSRRSPSPSIREALEEQACNSKNSLLNYLFHPILLWESCLQIPLHNNKGKSSRKCCFVQFCPDVILTFSHNLTIQTAR